MRLKSHLMAILLLCSTAAFAQTIVPSGTTIKVRTDQAIPAKPASGATYTATVSDDVQDANGTVIIPRGSRASLVAQNSDENNNDRVLDLRSVTVNGRRYMLTAAGQAGTASGGGAGYGMNKRTGLYVGGGAAVGAILGGLLGGGKGAALGAILGGAGGAGAQKVTGKDKNIPAETELSYKLAQDLQMQRSGYARRGGQLQSRPQQQ